MTGKRCLATTGGNAQIHRYVGYEMTRLTKMHSKLSVQSAVPCYVRRTSSQAAAGKIEDQYRELPASAHHERNPLGQSAKQKQANKEFFANLLSSAATKRDAKAYISRLKNPPGATPKQATAKQLRPQVNLGNLFGSARAVENSPVFSQYEVERNTFKELGTLHVALVKLCGIDQISSHLLHGVAETLSQLARLGISPCVVLESSSSVDNTSRQQLKLHAIGLADIIDTVSDTGARLVENSLAVTLSGEVKVELDKFLLTPLRRGQIPIIPPLAYSQEHQSMILVQANDAVLALARRFSLFNAGNKEGLSEPSSKQVSLDRIIVIDQAGGVPNPASSDGKHVFLNLEQEHSAIMQQLKQRNTPTSVRHVNNLTLLREALQLLPASASGLMATPEEAANLNQSEQDMSPSMVGTRRSKNILIHNLLTDKPAYSSSLPKTRLSKKSGTESLPSVTTFVKHGMPLTILPDPTLQPWNASNPRIKLTDAQIDLDRLVYLIDDSFNRKLDVEDYLRRVNERMAGVIIAGDYEGGAVLTWETPPGVDPNDISRQVPYLDKFAVLKRSQGAGGVADIVFNAMVRTCFPQGVCWRSRKNNPVNKWYFERSRGTRKIPDMNWTMFWTTPGVAEDRQKFDDYEGVCRGVEPSWLDKKMAAD